MNWFIFALLSALFAAFTAIFAKVGLRGVDSNLATAIRTVIVLFMAWTIVFATGASRGISSITKNNLLFLLLSGLATGFSWLFYFKALQMGKVSQVVAVDKLSIVFVFVFSVLLLNEPVSWQLVTGGLLIAAGTFIMLL